MPDQALTNRLRELADPEYRTFQCGLLPTVSPERVLGVRLPALRELAASLSGTPEAERFLADLPHRYYDEDNLHVMLLCRLRGYDRCLREVERFLPYLDNWLSCDSLRPSALLREPERLWEQCAVWMGSGQTYTRRFGLEMLMRRFLDDLFTPEVLERAAAVRSEEYYVNMMTAWLFATALAKQWDAALPYLAEAGRLEPWVRQKAARKALESRRVPPEHQRRLRELCGLPERGARRSGER